MHACLVGGTFYIKNAAMSVCYIPLCHVRLSRNFPFVDIMPTMFKSLIHISINLLEFEKFKVGAIFRYTVCPSVRSNSSKHVQRKWTRIN